MLNTLYISSYISSKRGKREQGTGNPPLATPPPRRGIIDDLWIIIDFIFDFYQMSIRPLVKVLIKSIEELTSTISSPYSLFIIPYYLTSARSLLSKLQ
ncbi:MAG: hypothetical protein F6K24_14415 [Okeania sp. SIO2D1]|nr:hypothetical protein [Okeania sp. SIO2D1]